MLISILLKLENQTSSLFQVDVISCCKDKIVTWNTKEYKYDHKDKCD